MEKVRIVYRPDKSVATIHPAPKSKRPKETENQWLERVFNKAMQGDLKGLVYDDIDISELPQNREDRNAWEGEKGKGVTINQLKANTIKADKKRETDIQKKLREIAIRELEASE